MLTGNRADTPKPEAILLVLDATNLGRHLMLAAPILALGVPTLIILNMADDLRNRNGKLDLAALSAELGAPVALISARAGEGVDKVYEFLAGVMPKPAPKTLPVLQDVPKCRAWAGTGERTGRLSSADPAQVDAAAGLGFPAPGGRTDRFRLVVVAVFQTIFSVADPSKEAIDWLFSMSGNWVDVCCPIAVPLAADRRRMERRGSVVAFLPQVLLLFLFIGILEDSGYLARAALIADRTMARVGLQGKSFIPLLSAYACAVPAIMSTRTIENKRDRIATILIAPFMTCSARLPVYGLVIAAFIPEQAVLGVFLSARTVAMISLYVLGFLAAVVTARVLKSSILKSGRTPFLLEMPSYRWPTWQSLGLRLLDRAKVFLRRAGTVILLVTVVLWMMANVPTKNGNAPASRTVWPERSAAPSSRSSSRSASTGRSGSG